MEQKTKEWSMDLLGPWYEVGRDRHPCWWVESAVSGSWVRAEQKQSCCFGLYKMKKSQNNLHWCASLGTDYKKPRAWDGGCREGVRGGATRTKLSICWFNYRITDTSAIFHRRKSPPKATPRPSFQGVGWKHLGKNEREEVEVEREKQCENISK